MIAGSALYPPMAVNLTVHEVSPLMTPPTSVPDIQIVSDGNGEQTARCIGGVQKRQPSRRWSEENGGPGQWPDTAV